MPAQTSLLLSCIVVMLAGRSAHAVQQGELSLWTAHAPRGADHALGELHWKHRIDTTFATDWHATVEPEFLVRSYQERSRTVAWGPVDPPASVALRQASLAWRKDTWQVRAGSQFFEWNQTDLISPADLVNPRDWSDITRTRKLAVPAVSVRHGYQTSLEWVWIPRPLASWLPAGPWMPVETSSLLAPSQQRPHGDQHAFRLTGNWRQTDWSFVLYRGHSTAPDLAMDATSPRPRLFAWYQPLRAAAVTAARQLTSSNVLRAELGHYRQPLGSDFTQVVVSADHEKSGLLEDDDMLYLLLQYAGSNRHDTVRNTLGWPDFRRVLERSVSFRLAYDFRSDQRDVIEINGAWNRKQHDRYWQVSYQKRLAGNTSLTVGIDAMNGREGSFWGRYRDNGRVWLQTSWKY